MKGLIVFILALLLFSCTSTPQTHEPRYVITSPEVAEIICMLDGQQHIVGVTEECDYPATLRNIPKVGKFGAVSREKIIALKPTIVFTSGLEQAALAQELQKLGIKTVVYYPKSIAEMMTGIQRIGDEIGAANAARTYTTNLTSKLSELRGQYRYLRKPKVFIEIYNNPLMSASSQSIVGEIVSLSGGVNIFPTLERDYARVKAEDVITANPDIIISFSQVPVRDIANRRGWEVINAVKNQTIFVDADIDPDLIQRAGPRMLDGIEALRALYLRAGFKLQ